MWQQRRKKGRNSPWHAQPELALDLDKVGEDAEDGGGRDEHEQHPQVELDGGPVVLVEALDAPLVDDGRVRHRGRHRMFILESDVRLYVRACACAQSI